jgi:predicted RNA-binding protein with RPS1 domain
MNDTPEGGAETPPAKDTGSTAEAVTIDAAHKATNDTGAEAAAGPAQPAVNPARRRIAIGTQRSGGDGPGMTARYTYATSATKSVEAGLPTSPVAPAATPGASGDGPESVAPASDQPKQPERRSSGRDRRRRGGSDRDSKSAAFSDALPPQRQVAVPNLRQGLDEDLEGDFAAAVAGLEVDALLEQATLVDQPIPPGAKVQGTVLSIGPETAFIDLGNQRQGALQLASLYEEEGELPEVGQVLELSVGGRNEDDGLYELAPANRAVAVEDWSQLEVGMIVEARCTGTNKGGLECEVAGLRGFMPAGLVSPWRIENLEEMVGQTLESLVTELVPRAHRLVLSRRAVIEKQAADARAEMLETLEAGETVEGIVRSVRDFGAFIDIGHGVEGLVHVSQLSWERITDPNEILKPGQAVKAVVKKVDRETGKIGLSIRDLVESPWSRADAKYPMGSTVRGTVSRIADFGAFVKLEPGIEGLIHVSELATRRIRSVGDVVSEGETIECRVLSVDPAEQRLSLSLKALSKAATADDQASEEDAAPPAETPRKKRTGPLKGGVGGQSEGARFGLKW